MGIKPVTYYEASCDKPGCGTTTSDLGDYSAWADAGQALSDFIDSDGWENEKTGELFCHKHRPPLCVECDDVPATGLDKDGEQVCDNHHPVKGLSE